MKKTNKITRNVLFTNEVYRGLLMLREYASMYETINAQLCDNALIHGFKAGCTVYKDNNVLKGLDNNKGKWSEISVKAIIELKDLVKDSILFAKNMQAKNNVLQGPPHIEDELCEKWSAAAIVNKTCFNYLLMEIYSVTSVYLCLINDEYQFTFRQMRQMQFVYAIETIIHGIKEGKRRAADKAAIDLIKKFQAKFPEANLPMDPDNDNGRYILTIREKGYKGIEFTMLSDQQEEGGIECHYRREGDIESDPMRKFTMCFTDVKTIRYEKD